MIDIAEFSVTIAAAQTAGNADIGFRKGMILSVEVKFGGGAPGTTVVAFQQLAQGAAKLETLFTKTGNTDFKVRPRATATDQAGAASAPEWNTAIDFAGPLRMAVSVASAGATIEGRIVYSDGGL